MTAYDKTMQIISHLSSMVPPSERASLFFSVEKIMQKTSPEEIDFYYYKLIEEPKQVTRNNRKQISADEILLEMQKKAKKTYLKRCWKWKGE